MPIRVLLIFCTYYYVTISRLTMMFITSQKSDFLGLHSNMSHVVSVFSRRHVRAGIDHRLILLYIYIPRVYIYFGFAHRLGRWPTTSEV